MRTALLTTFVILLSAGICWGQMDTTQVWFDTFRIVPAFGTPTVLDSFELGTGPWWDPDASGSTYGTYYALGEAYNTNSTIFVHDTVTVHDGLGSAMLQYQWNHPDSAGLIREYPGTTGPIQETQFGITDKLEVWLYGNASGDLFRFCIDDSDGHEASEWLPIDWTGWQLVTWDLATDTVIAWVGGNGALDGPMVDFDSFQIEKAAVTVVEPQSMGSGEMPQQYTLSQNYPNPFNAETQIQFSVAKAGQISLKVYNVTGQLINTLVEEEKGAGSYRVRWNGTDQHGGVLASGVYFCRMEADNFAQSIKMTFLR
jgi:hypothetical protein